MRSDDHSLYKKKSTNSVLKKNFWKSKPSLHNIEKWPNYFKNLAVFTLQIFKVSLVIFQHHIWKGQGLLRKTFINECTLTNMRTIHPVTSLKENSSWAIFTAQKKFSIKYFFSKWDQIHSFLRIWSHLLKKSFMKSFTFCADFLASTYLSRKLKIAGV